jgi:hypothetical protein
MGVDDVRRDGPELVLQQPDLPPEQIEAPMPRAPSKREVVEVQTLLGDTNRSYDRGIQGHDMHRDPAPDKLDREGTDRGLRLTGRRTVEGASKRGPEVGRRARAGEDQSHRVRSCVQECGERRS